MTQIPWFDKLWHKSAIMAHFKQQKGSPILKVVGDKIAQRRKELASGEKDRDAGRKDFLSSYLDIQSSNTSIPPWYGDLFAAS